MQDLDFLYKDVVKKFSECEMNMINKSITSNNSINADNLIEADTNNTKIIKTNSDNKLEHKLPSSDKKLIKNVEKSQNSPEKENKHDFMLMTLKQDNENLKCRLNLSEKRYDQLQKENAEIKNLYLNQNNTLTHLYKEINDLKVFCKGFRKNNLLLYNNYNNNYNNIQPQLQVNKTVTNSKNVILNSSNIKRNICNSKIQTCKPPDLKILINQNKKFSVNLSKFCSVENTDKLDNADKIDKVDKGERTKSIVVDIATPLEEKDEKEPQENDGLCKNEPRMTKNELAPNSGKISFVNLVVNLTNSEQFSVDDINLYYNENEDKLKTEEKTDKVILNLNLRKENPQKLKTTQNQNDIPALNLTFFPGDLDTTKQQNISDCEGVNSTSNTQITGLTPMTRNERLKSEVYSETEALEGKAKLSLLNSEKKNYNCLNFENIPKTDFNDEFTLNYDEFSQSWRDQCDRLNLRHNKKTS